LVGCLLAFLVIGLELFCWLFSLSLADTGASREVWSLWRQAMWAIPITGLLAAWAMGRQTERAVSARLLGGILSLGGALASAYWIWQTLTLSSGSLAGNLLSAMALIPALLLLSAGIKLSLSAKNGRHEVS